MSHSYKAGNLTKDKLINETGKLAAEIGIANVTIGKIGKITGENKGTIHYHFHSRDQLLEAVMRQTTQSWDKTVLNEILSLLETSPSDKKNQAKVLKMTIDWHLDQLFTDKKPEWYRKVLYQGLDASSNLSEIITEEVFNLQGEAFKKIFLIIDPTLSKEEAFIYSVMIATPIFIHAQREDLLASKLNKKFLDKDYLEKFKSMLVKQTLKNFDLPNPF